MHRIHYAGTSILTGSAIAIALVDYAQALAEVGSSATVDVPTLHDDGTPGRSDILVGPASQLMADDEDSTYDEVADEQLVAHMNAEAQHLRQHGSPSPSIAIGRPDEPADWTDFDL